MSYTVWVDGDSCSVANRTILTRASRTRSVKVVFVADRSLPIEEHEYLFVVSVGSANNSADIYIMENLTAGDIVVTRDIELTGAAVEADAVVLDGNGKRFTRDNVAERRSMHRFMSSFRDGKIEVSSPGEDETNPGGYLGDRHGRGGGTRRRDGAGTQAFANALDREITART